MIDVLKDNVRIKYGMIHMHPPKMMMECHGQFSGREHNFSINLAVCPGLIQPKQSSRSKLNSSELKVFLFFLCHYAVETAVPDQEGISFFCGQENIQLDPCI